MRSAIAGVKGVLRVGKNGEKWGVSRVASIRTLLYSGAENRPAGAPTRGQGDVASGSRVDRMGSGFLTAEIQALATARTGECANTDGRAVVGSDAGPSDFEK